MSHHVPTCVLKLSFTTLLFQCKKGLSSKVISWKKIKGTVHRYWSCLSANKHYIIINCLARKVICSIIALELLEVIKLWHVYPWISQGTNLGGIFTRNNITYIVPKTILLAICRKEKVCWWNQQPLETFHFEIQVCLFTVPSSWILSWSSNLAV